MKLPRAILRRTVNASKRFTVWLSVPTVLFVAAVGPFLWGLYQVNETLAVLVPSGAMLGLSLWQSRHFLIGPRAPRTPRQ